MFCAAEVENALLARLAVRLTANMLQDSARHEDGQLASLRVSCASLGVRTGKTRR